MKRLILSSLFSMLMLNVFGQQPEIVSVLPNQGFQNSNINIVVRGSNTHFRQGQTTIQFGNGDIIVNKSTINVQDQRTLTASIQIPASAKVTDYDVTVVSGSEKVRLSGAFSVLPTNSPMTATLNILPVQTIAVSDFDANNIKNSPLLFVISLYNAGGHGSITATLTVTGAQYGLIGTAVKRMRESDVTSSNPYRFSNRDFDKVDVSQASKNFMNMALSTGLLPPDDYTFKIVLTDEKGVKIEVDGVNTISNPQSGLQLISPGAPMGGDPETVNNKYPQFQWFSQASKFDLTLYKVNKPKSTASDVTSQLPILTQKDLTTTTFIYPNSARILEEGVTYAWQITAHIYSSKGDKPVLSEVYWFTVGKPSSDFSNVVRMEVAPGDIEMGVGDTVRLRATAFNAKEEVVHVNPEWRITPADGGTVTQDGKFTAGTTPMTVAVVAKYGNVQEYSTVKINPAGANGAWDFSSFIEKVFGLPKK